MEIKTRDCVSQLMKNAPCLHSLLTFNLGKWQQSPAFQDLLTDFDFQAIGESNIDLINYGYIAYMLRKNQAIHDFWASLRLACLHEWLTYHKGSTSAVIIMPFCNVSS